MKIEIQEGYDIVIIAETKAERKRLGKLNDKWLNCGLRVDLIGIPGLCHQLTIRPKSPDERTIEIGG